MFSKTNKTKKSFIGAIAMSLVLLMGSALGVLIETNLGQITKPSSGLWTDYATEVIPAGDYFYIMNANQLAYLAKNPSVISGKYIRLMADIDLAGHEWVPINGAGVSGSNPVYTDFDGNGHMISNMMINQPTTDSVGLFGSYSYIKINNVNLSGVNVLGNTYVGAMLGDALNVANITNVNVTSGKVISKGGMVGGVAGRVLGTIKDCTNNAEVISYGQGVGGIAYATMRVENCINTGDVIGTSKVAGLVANGALTAIINSYAECDITGDSTIGGIAATFTLMTGTVNIENSGYKGRITVLGESPEDIGAFVGGNDNYNSTSGKLAIKNSFALAEVVLKNTTSKDSIKNYGAEATDSVSYTSSYCYTDVITSEGETKLKRYKVGVSETEPFKDMVYHANINGGYPFPKSLFAVGQYIGRDTMTYLEDYGFEGLRIKNDGSHYYIELGEYPQTYVGDSLNSTLESWYRKESPTQKRTFTNNSATISSKSYVSYIYQGHEYVRMSISGSVYDKCYNYTFENNAKVGDALDFNANMIWIKVEPIKWWILNYTDVINGAAAIVISEKALMSDVPWNKTQEIYRTWEDSNIRSWLNGSFYNEAFDTFSKSSIFNQTNENSTSNNHTDGSGTATNDNVWLMSYGQVYGESSTQYASKTYFSSNSMRQCSPTDFAILNTAVLDSSYTTQVRPHGGTTWWMLRSPNPTTMPIVDYVGPSGGLLSQTSYSTTYAVRPSLTLNL